eukprot:scaffold3242_cov351-Prasinococcus_capsulatus_cf.AAC.2
MGKSAYCTPLPQEVTGFGTVIRLYYLGNVGKVLLVPFDWKVETLAQRPALRVLAMNLDCHPVIGLAC